MDKETEHRTLVSGAAFKLLVSWFKNNKCSCAILEKNGLSTPCHFCRSAKEFKKAFPLEYQAATEFIALNWKTGEL